MTILRHPAGAAEGALASPRGTSISRFRRARRLVFHGVVRSLVGGVRRAPRPLAEATLVGLARLARATRTRERSVARRQVRAAFPDLAVSVADRVADASWTRLARDLVDMVRADAPPEIDARSARCLDDARARGPVLLLMAHLGAWELVGPALSARMAPFGALTANPHNDRVDAWLRAERAARGFTVFDRDRDLGSAARWLRRGGTLAVLADHRPRGAHVRAPWFHGWVPTTTGPGRLAHGAGATILPVGVARRGRRHHLLVGDGFRPEGDATTDARRCNAALEELVRQDPEGWTWIHAREQE